MVLSGAFVALLSAGLQIYGCCQSIVNRQSVNV